MLHEIHQTNERKLSKSAFIAGAFLVSSMVEVGRSTHAIKKKEVSGLMSYPADDGPSFIFLRGCGENYAAQAPLHARKLARYGSLHFEYQTQGRHSQEMIDQHIIDACKIDGNRDRVLVGTSMGLMNGMKSLTNPQVREAIGENRLKAIISRSGMTSQVDLQPGMRRAAAVSAYIPKLALFNDVWRAHRLRRVDSNLRHIDEMTLEEARLHHESSAYMPFQLVSSQHRAIHKSVPWQANSHRGVVEENPDLQLYQITAEEDNVVDWRRSKVSLEQAFGLPVETAIDYRRPSCSHADELEYIEPLARYMEHLSDTSSQLAVSAARLFHFRDGRVVA